jgi:poly(ADP-ribose) glycohydrolase ARH3
MTLTADQFTGCVLGLATGDALGAPHEGGPLERFVWWILGIRSSGQLRWTDDTQMTIDLAESLLADGGVQPDSLAKRFAASYRWSRGYGPGAARVLKRIRRGEPWEQASKAVYAEGSFGNGAAMRVPVVALFYARDRVAMLAAVRSSALITHSHPVGIEGAILIASAAHALLEQRSPTEILEIVEAECSRPEIAKRLKKLRVWIETNATPSPREVAIELGNGITAAGSCPTALYLALRHMQTSFESLMEFAIACRGDVDTIAAMSGALWGIVNGAKRLPQVRLEARDRLEHLAAQLFERYQQSVTATTQ